MSIDHQHTELSQTWIGIEAKCTHCKSVKEPKHSSISKQLDQILSAEFKDCCFLLRVNHGQNSSNSLQKKDYVWLLSMSPWRKLSKFQGEKDTLARDLEWQQWVSIALQPHSFNKTPVRARERLMVSMHLPSVQKRGAGSRHSKVVLKPSWQQKSKSEADLQTLIKA